MTIEQPLLIYYYALRSGDFNEVPESWRTYPPGLEESKAKDWEIISLIEAISFRTPGLYTHKNGNRYYMHQIPWEEFDLLTAFDVPYTIGFEYLDYR